MTSPLIRFADADHAETFRLPVEQRLQTHPSGVGWIIVTDPNDPNSPTIDREGAPLTLEEAESVLDWLDQRKQNPPPPAAENNQRKGQATSLGRSQESVAEPC